MTRTYYEAVDANEQPANARQRAALGTPRYGYTSRVRAELACPDEGTVYERHQSGSDDWRGRAVSIRLSTGVLMRLIP